MSVIPSRPSRLGLALQALDRSLDAPRRPGVPLGNWRWQVRQQIAAVREALANEADAGDAWLEARGGDAFAERNQLLGRLGALAPQVLATADVEATRTELKHLIGDIRQHAQRAVAAPLDPA